MQIARNRLDTQAGPSDRFTSAVYIDTVAAPSDGSRLSASSVHFTPGARTAWHTHANGHTIYVLEGVGLCQRRGGPVDVIRPGDRVFFEPGEEHWHGAAATRFMTHLAMLEVDNDGNAANWGRARQRRGIRGGAGDRLSRPSTGRMGLWERRGLIRAGFRVVVLFLRLPSRPSSSRVHARAT
jgi:quercetin dioxygenase-like cupin family protein